MSASTESGSAIVLPVYQRPAQSWSARLWGEIDGELYPAILAHPFVTGLTDGTLPADVFAHFVAQDVHYLRDYARALSIASAKAPTLADTAMFARHAAQVYDVELALHNELLPQLGLRVSELGAVPVAPTTRAYTSYLLATAYDGSFADGLATVLPCYWIYARVGLQLAQQGSPDPRYQLWIDSYGGEDFAATVAEVLDLTDRTGVGLSASGAAIAQGHFMTTARYEWMFFDAAYRLERWPI